ncbi:B3 domain-containing transcription repressor VAL1-like isoform X3 [Salvia miltiorrhiza]|uniref:B3 domain-containing transcription repressor VAL1-like isoform X3 n=1 Tax=Salvia miltiorrhiza TaxID=226208 RepID=UPI0025AD4594|nr:B3 domain-containing transcription repressor VAL1-like isoform X3 [Salvia miltiorrhiza]
MAAAAAASSSSSSRMSCFQCQDSSFNHANFRNGWRLRSGEFAQLCPRCASAYDDGRFCETFHSNDDGWRDCGSCGKLVHCGCIVSFSTHLLLDFGGIICMECSRLNFLLARKRCMSLEPEVRAREHRPESSGQAPVEAQNWPQVTDSELQKVSRNPRATVTPLFEKILSASDADLKLARLIIPKRCAENFFPDISGLHGLRIKIQDIDGNEWEFHYRYWLNGGSRIYVLEGLRDYMVSKKWQSGDTVTFYRVEPGGKVVMGLRKTSGSPQLQRYGLSLDSCSNHTYVSFYVVYACSILL